MSNLNYSNIETIKLSQMSNRPSESFLMNRSYISNTGINQNLVQQLKKSRIQNLPNYKKINLTENLPFVVIFQTIEIQRLSNQIESNRIKIKDFERQIFNAQNYEVQIRELTEKLFAYEQERQNYSQQTEKLNLICHQMYSELQQMKKKYNEVDFTLKEKYQLQRNRSAQLLQEIQKWKARYMAAEKNDLRLMMESQRKSMVDRQMRELTIKFQGERGNLENEIRKLRQGMEYKNRELDQYKQKCQKYEINIMELRSNLSQLNQYENKIALITQQMLRLNQVLRSKQDEIENYKQREYQFQQKIREQGQWQFQNKQLKSTLENRLRQIEEWKVRCSKLQENVNRNRQLASINNQLSNKLNIAMVQLQRVNNVIRSKLDQIQQWKQRLANQELQTNKYRNLQKELENYQRKINTLTSEIQRLNNVLKNRLAELEDWKMKYSKLEVTINNYMVIERDNKELQDRINLQNRANEQYKNKIARYESQLNNMRILERKLEDADKKNAIFNSEIERLNNILRGKVQEVQDYKVRYSKLEYKLADYKNIQLKVKEYEGKLDQLTQQIQKYMNIVRSKNGEIDRLNNNTMRLEDELGYLRSAESKLAESERMIQTLNNSIENFKKDFKKWQDKYKGLEGRARELQSNIFNISQQKQKISSILKNKSNDFDDLKSRYTKLQNQNYQAKEIEANFYEIQNRYNILTMQIQRMEKINREFEMQIERERALSTELAFKVIVLSAEIQRNSDNSGIKSKDFRQLQEKFYQLQSANRQKDNQILVISQKIINFEAQIAFFAGELERYMGLIAANQKRAKQLEKEIIQYQDYARRIHILSAEIDRIASENKGLEDDIRRLRLRYADQISAQTRHQGFCLMFCLMSAEIQGLRNRINEKEIQFHEMRKSILEPVRNIK